MNVHRRNILCLIELDFAAGADDQLFVGDDIKGFVTQTDGLEMCIRDRRNYYCDKNGPVAGFEKVDSENDIILITDSGIIIRIPADQISKQSRYAGGVKVMRVDEETSIIGIAAVEKEEESEQESDSSAENELSAPVSYTHLDVYKRQPTGSSSSGL